MERSAMKPFSLVLLVGLGSVLTLGGCDSTKEMLGYSRKAPDEFAVYQRAPLSVPPEFSLRPPEPGTGRPQETQAKDQARQAIVGDKRARGAPPPRPAGTSSGEYALLKQANALEVDPEIRQIVNREFTIYQDESVSVTEKILFWQKPLPPGPVVDPAKESARIRENQALGKPITEGETAIKPQKRKGIFQSDDDD